MYIYLHKGILLSHACAKLLQSCMTLYDPMDCSPPGSSVRGISQARILEWLSCSSPYLAIKRMKYCHLQQHEWIWRILYLVSFICGILNNTKESIYKAETDTQTQHTCACQGGSGMGEGQTGSLGLPDANYYIKNG